MHWQSSALLMACIGIAVLTWIGVEGVRRIAPRLKLIAVPNERSSHSVPVPVGGGMAIFVVVLGVWLVLALFRHDLMPQHQAVTLVLAASLLAVVSLIDDVRHVPFLVRLGVHAMVALDLALGVARWTSITMPLLGTISLGAFGLVLTVLWIVGLINAFNFMDGIDGMAGGQAVAAGAGWVMLGLLTGSPLLTLMGGVLAASSLGFLVHNWHPATIFLGDVGSTFLGLSFAVLPVIGAHDDPRLAVAGVLLVWPAVFDSGFTVLRRLRNHENVFTGHRAFLFHRLVGVGWSHAAASSFYVVLPLLGAALAYTWEFGTRPIHEAVALALVALCLGLWRFVRAQEARQMRIEIQDSAVSQPVEEPAPANS
jgi:UDP-N-acetylmuramyl pentapeptide phosphotransferase/UDP-N-acetylglucosamine-1-phosphate transferase